MAVIPARGGSKRIPRKNVREFAGKPMIAHSIEAAFRSRLFDRVIVSTDDAEIAAVAVRYGAEVPFLRPAALSNDHAGTTEVIAHAVTWLRTEGLHPSAVCCIYATAPFVRVDDLAQGLMTMEAGEWQFVFSATDFAFPIFRSFGKNPDMGLKMFFPEHFATRSQDLPDALHDAGQFYWGRPQAWVDGVRIFSESSTIVMIPRWRVQDIDTDDDWARAELMSRYISSDSSSHSQRHNRLRMKPSRSPNSTEQDQFWAETYAEEYIRKNSTFDKALGRDAWTQMLRRAEGIERLLECGCGIGRNISFLNEVRPKAKKSIIEISKSAFQLVTKAHDLEHAFNGSILDSDFEPQSFDLVYTMGVLIHIPPDRLVEHMRRMLDYSRRYVLMGEYFNRTPVMIEYQGQQDKLFKRDFGKVFIETFDVKLVDYGFLWGHLYDTAGFDDLTWWLFEKR